MVVLTIITTNNSHTVYLNEALVNFQRMKLISCSPYNSWHNLKIEGQIGLYDNPSIDSYFLKQVPAGNYNIETLDAVLNKNFDNKAQVEIRTPKAALEINNRIGIRIEIDKDLVSLLGVKIKKKFNPKITLND